MGYRLDSIELPSMTREEVVSAAVSFGTVQLLPDGKLIFTDRVKLNPVPGFSYMGEVDEKIAMPRKPQPEMVLAGSVGIAGKQTGIYPLDSPGGWQIIGRTPLKIFDATREQPSLIKAGDRIQFYPISKDEFTHY